MSGGLLDEKALEAVFEAVRDSKYAALRHETPNEEVQRLIEVGDYPIGISNR